MGYGATFRIRRLGRSVRETISSAVTITDLSGGDILYEAEFETSPSRSLRKEGKRAPRFIQIGSVYAPDNHPETGVTFVRKVQLPNQNIKLHYSVGPEGLICPAYTCRSAKFGSLSLRDFVQELSDAYDGATIVAKRTKYRVSVNLPGTAKFREAVESPVLLFYHLGAVNHMPVYNGKRSSQVLEDIRARWR